MFSLFFASKDDPALIENGPYRPFSFLHIVLMLMAFASIYLLIRHVRHKKYRGRFIWVCSAYALLVLLNVFRFAWDAGTGEFDIRQDIPLQLCGIQMFTLPFALFNRGKAGEHLREFAFSYGTVGFVLALLMPFTTQFDYPVLHFRNIQSLLYHTDMGFIALMLPHIGYRPDIKNAHKADNVLFACIAVTAVVNIAAGSNYLYTSNLPISFELLRWPLYIPFFGAFIIFAGRVPYIVYNYLQNRVCDDHGAHQT
jgi:hypothetical integral membrane protein (TIGR02206 family)